MFCRPPFLDRFNRFHPLYAGAIVTSLLLGCSDDSDSPTTTPPVDDEPLAEETIGPEGGMLEAPGFALEIPNGAFTTANDLVLHEESGALPFGSRTGSKAFRVDGLPDDYAEPLALRIRLEGTVDAPMAAIGEEVYVKSESRTRVAWRLHAADDSAGWCLWEVPPPEASSPGASPSSALGRGTTPTVRFTTVAEYRSQPSTGKHFAIDFPSLTVTDAQAAQLNVYLEEAYSTFYNMGFRYRERTEWPVQVTVKELDTGKFGAWIASGWGPNSCGFEFNSLKMSDLDELRITAGHEVFHMFQYSYDPRTPRQRATDGGPNYWLDEATAVWSERKFTEKASYVSAVRKANEMTPLTGLQAGAAADPANHGYGLSSFMEYISSRQGEDFVLDAYEGTSAGQTPLSALLPTLSQPIQAWWGDYLRELLAGGIYGDVTGNMARDERSGLATIFGAADTSGTFAADYPDLSGRTYLFRLQYPEIGEGTSLELTTPGNALTSIATYRYQQNGNLTLLGHGPGPVQVPNLRSLTDDGWWVVALVANHEHNRPNYDSTTPIQLDWKVVDRLDLSIFDTAIISIRYEADWGTSTVEWQGLNFSREGGGFADNTFVVEWDEVDPDSGTRFVGHIYVTVDPDGLDIVDWDAESNWIFTAPGTSNYYKAWGGRVELTDQDPDELEYNLSGEETCSGITDIAVTFREDGQIDRDLAGHSCNGDSYLRIRLRDD